MQVIRNSPKAGYLLMVTASKPGSVLSVTAYPKPFHFSYSDNYAFDRYSGKIIAFLASLISASLPVTGLIIYLGKKEKKKKKKEVSLT